MTYLSRIKSTVISCVILTKEVLMENRRRSAPVAIRFANRQEAIDLTTKIEFKYFMAKLLFSHYTQSV